MVSEALGVPTHRASGAFPFPWSISGGERRIQVVCPSCQPEGEPGVIRKKELLNDPGPSHGISLTHRRKLEVALRTRLT